jgi:hypothetical protein
MIPARWVERLSIAHPDSADAHPDSAELTETLAPLFRDNRVTISSATARLRATIKTQDGLRELT